MDEADVGHDNDVGGGGAPRRTQNRGRAWCFTWNQDPENFQGVPCLNDFGEHATYLCFGEELAPTTGQYHLQGYIHFSRQVAFSTVTSVLPDAHFERAKGSAIANRVYCQKDGRFSEEGVLPRAGARTDLAAVGLEVKQGATMKRIAEEFPVEFIKHASGIQKLKFTLAPKRDWAMTLIFIIGPTGSGKTYRASQWCKDNGYTPYWKDGTKWWDRYEGEEVVIWDEFYGHCCKFSDLLRLTDRYPFQVETKGGYVEFNSKVIIFTSNQEPEEWYNKEKTHQMDWSQNPLNRRIEEFGMVIRTGDQSPAPAAAEAEPMDMGQDYIAEQMLMQRPPAAREEEEEN